MACTVADSCRESHMHQASQLRMSLVWTERERRTLAFLNAIPSNARKTYDNSCLSPNKGNHERERMFLGTCFLRPETQDLILIRKGNDNALDHDCCLRVICSSVPETHVQERMFPRTRVLHS